MNVLVISIFLLGAIYIKSYADYRVEPVFYCSTNNERSQTVFDSDYWRDINQNQINLLSSMHYVPQAPDLQTMSTAQLEHYFAAHHLSEREILEQPQLYMSDAYIALVKKYSLYSAYIKKYYEKYVQYGFARKCLSWIKGSYKSGMAQRFIDLHQEQVRAEHAKKLIQEQAQQAAYHEQLQKIEHELITKNVQTPYARTRIEALRATAVNDARIQRKVVITEDAQHFAKEYEIEQSMLEHGFMNPYEYQLHTEFIDQLNVAVQLQSMPNKCREHQVLLDTIGYGVSLGLEANHNHEAATATHWADCGWWLLDILRPISEGIALGCYNTIMLPVNLAMLAGQAAAHPIAHPVESLNILGQGIKTILFFFVEEFRRLGPQEGPPVDFEQEWNTLLDRIDDAIAYCEEQLAKVPSREKVKYVTAFLTEIALPTKFFKAGKILCTRMRPLVRTALQIIQDEQIAVKVAGAAAGENILMKVTEGIQEAGSAVKGIIQESATALELFHANLMKNLEPEIAALRSLFDNKVKGFGEFANKYLKIDYEHILGMELSFNRKGLPVLNGFHHDYMNAIEKGGVVKFTNKLFYKDGFYKTDLFLGEKIFPGKTFFPGHWSREQVISTLYEAYSNFIKSGQLPLLGSDGKYKINSIIKGGIEIEMYITKKGRIATAYPVLK